MNMKKRLASAAKRCRKESGQFVVLFTAIFVVFCGAAALTIDFGRVVLEKDQLQNAVDAAALAGANALPDASGAKSAALAYTAKNGADSSDVTAESPYQGDSEKIEVSCTKQIDYYFARILGFTSRNVSVSAVAARALGDPGPFRFAVFSGSTTSPLGLNGSNINIEGSVHANNCIAFNATNNNITGSAEAVSTIYVNSNIGIIGVCQAPTVYVNSSGGSIGSVVRSAVPTVAMPDLGAALLQEAQQSGTCYSGNYVIGNGTQSANLPLYVNGSVYVNSANLTGSGYIVATGDIVFNGSVADAVGSGVCFYSLNGSVYFNAGSVTVYGTIYAPNGNIIFNGSNDTVYGRLVGKCVYLNQGNIHIIPGDSDLNFLPRSKTRLVR